MPSVIRESHGALSSYESLLEEELEERQSKRRRLSHAYQNDKWRPYELGMPLLFGDLKKASSYEESSDEELEKTP